MINNNAFPWLQSVSRNVHSGFILVNVDFWLVLLSSCNEKSPTFSVTKIPTPKYLVSCITCYDQPDISCTFSNRQILPIMGSNDLNPRKSLSKVTQISTTKCNKGTRHTGLDLWGGVVGWV